MKLTPDTTEFKTFFDGCRKINHTYMVGLGCDDHKDDFLFTKGRKYIKVIRDSGVQKSVHCFVNMVNGDVLMASSWKSPAKHARGNVFDENNGLGSMGEYGPAYLR